MKQFTGCLFVLIIIVAVVWCGVRVKWYDPAARPEDRRCSIVGSQLIWSQSRKVNENYPVLAFDFFDDGRYDVYLGEVSLPEDSHESRGSLVLMRSGMIDAEHRSAVRSLAKEYELSNEWFGRRIDFVMATNSNFVITHEQMDVLRFAVTNAVSNGAQMRRDAVHPLAWQFWDEAETNMFWRQ